MFYKAIVDSEYLSKLTHISRILSIWKFVSCSHHKTFFIASQISFLLMIMIKSTDTLLLIMLCPEFEKYVIRLDPSTIAKIEKACYYPILQN